MGNSAVKTVKAVKAVNTVNVIDIINSVNTDKSQPVPTHCPTCNHSGTEFYVSTRDGTRRNQMFFCNSCKNTWKGVLSF
jgi:DNA-directed RNA polymerase subunit M/transcription elongation factor TFIIS